MNRRAFCSLPLAALPAWTQVDAGAPKAAIERWKDLRFGMFIHWGPVSIIGTEISWSRGGQRRGRHDAHTGNVPVEIYDNLYRIFNPVKFNPDLWVQLAKDSGMKYLVFTTKHHDGFCEFDSKLTDYKITSPRSPYRKDIVRQIADACHRGGINWGVYYSQPDWHNPDYRNGARHAKYIEYMHGQIRELLTNYGKTGMWFFDGLGGSAADWDAPHLLRMMRQLQPDLVINDRAGVPADYDTPEQTIGTFQNTRPWETCATVGQQWAYNPDDVLRPIEECLRGLVCCAIGDGNLLFNVGPRPDGLIEESHAARLREMGAFLNKYGESIYDTRGGPFVAPGEKQAKRDEEGFALPQGKWWGGSTNKANTIYLHILRWPAETVTLPAIPRRIVRHTLLTGGHASLKQSPSGIEVNVPPAARHAVDTIVKLDLDGPARSIPVISWEK
ncbi:MAG TPA: alpha-L-fucosidase [Bryobacteraceae bacterium]|nr:alpha-L-fucosidase [Bryobacteraceae bacterium]